MAAAVAARVQWMRANVVGVDEYSEVQLRNSAVTHVARQQAQALMQLAPGAAMGDAQKVEFEAHFEAQRRREAGS